MAAASKLEAVEKLTGEGKLPTLIYTGAPGQKAARWPTPGMTDLGDKLHQTSQLGEYLMCGCYVRAMPCDSVSLELVGRS